MAKVKYPDSTENWVCPRCSNKRVIVGPDGTLIPCPVCNQEGIMPSMFVDESAPVGEVRLLTLEAVEKLLQDAESVQESVDVTLETPPAAWDTETVGKLRMLWERVKKAILEFFTPVNWEKMNDVELDAARRVAAREQAVALIDFLRAVPNDEDGQKLRELVQPLLDDTKKLTRDDN